MKRSGRRPGVDRQANIVSDAANYTVRVSLNARGVASVNKGIVSVVMQTRDGGGFSFLVFTTATFLDLVDRWKYRVVQAVDSVAVVTREYLVRGLTSSVQRRLEVQSRREDLDSPSPHAGS